MPLGLAPNANCARLLVQFKADPNQVDEDLFGSPLLTTVTFFYRSDVIHFLIDEAGVDPNQEVYCKMSEALIDSEILDSDDVFYMCEGAYGKHVLGPVEWEARWGGLPLMVAAVDRPSRLAWLTQSHGQEQVVWDLMKRGAEIVAWSPAKEEVSRPWVRGATC